MATRRVFDVNKAFDWKGNTVSTIKMKEGEIQILENSPYANGMNSVTKFYIKPGSRGQGLSKELLAAAKRRYDNLSAQASNEKSVRSLYSSGFRATNPNLKLQEILRILDRDTSVQLVWRRNG